jgi:hypothetical protein
MLSSPAATGSKGQRSRPGRQRTGAKPGTIWYSRAREPINSASLSSASSEDEKPVSVHARTRILEPLTLTRVSQPV